MIFFKKRCNHRLITQSEDKMISVTNGKQRNENSQNDGILVK